MYQYEEIDNDGVITVKRTDSDGMISFIPAIESNSDYQRYLRWLENPNAEEQGGLI